MADLPGKDALTIAVLLLMAVFAGFLAGCGRSAPVVETAAVPDVVGTDPQEAGVLLWEAGLKMGTAREIYSDTIPGGKVVSTMPPAGEELDRGSAVDLEVSKGPEAVAVPALLGSAEADAISALRALGFQVEVIRAYDESVGAGLVCAMEPAPDTPAGRSSTVTLTVSQGSAYVRCGTCGGDGRVTTDVTCPECGGTGSCYT